MCEIIPRGFYRPPNGWKPSSTEKLALKTSDLILHCYTLQHNTITCRNCADEEVVAWPENMNVEMNTILFQEAPQGKRWDSRSGTPGAKQHSYPAKQQEEAIV